MPKVLRNYYFRNNQVKILDIKGIFPDIPPALCDLGKEYKNPVVVFCATEISRPKRFTSKMISK